jgi:hypothetical protein
VSRTRKRTTRLHTVLLGPSAWSRARCRSLPDTAPLPNATTSVAGTLTWHDRVSEYTQQRFIDGGPAPPFINTGVKIPRGLLPRRAILHAVDSRRPYLVPVLQFVLQSKTPIHSLVLVTVQVTLIITTKLLLIQSQYKLHLLLLLYYVII